MKKLEYVIRDEIGIHARPAGELVKEAKKYNSRITISKVDGCYGTWGKMRTDSGNYGRRRG